MAETQPLIRIEHAVRIYDLSAPAIIRFLSRLGGNPIAPARLHAVDGVSLEIEKGTTFGLVGESGCGKSTLARMAVGLTKPSSGQVLFNGTQVTAPGGGSGIGRGRLQMVFQDPFASVNPRWRVQDIVAEPLARRGVARSEQRQTVAHLLSQVGLTPADAGKFPHEFSGGQRQRISIARALASNPDFLVCDEPTSALDVSVQAQILNLMRDLQAELGLTYLFISHDLAVISHMADRVGVMYLGRIVETGQADVLFKNPRHPYTRMLMDAIPDLDKADAPHETAQGDVADPLNRPTGCHFHPRCPHANDRCRTEEPKLRKDAEGSVSCHAVEEGRLPPAQGTL